MWTGSTLCFGWVHALDKQLPNTLWRRFLLFHKDQRCIFLMKVSVVVGVHVSILAVDGWHSLSLLMRLCLQPVLPCVKQGPGLRTTQCSCCRPRNNFYSCPLDINALSSSCSKQVCFFKLVSVLTSALDMGKAFCHLDCHSPQSLASHQQGNGTGS